MEIVRCRAAELGIDEVYQGVDDKLAVYRGLKEKYRLDDEEIAYIGDDLNDLPLINLAGLSFAVADAVQAVKETATVVTTRNGGEGAVREAIEMILRTMKPGS